MYCTNINRQLHVYHPVWWKSQFNKTVGLTKWCNNIIFVLKCQDKSVLPLLVSFVQYQYFFCTVPTSACMLKQFYFEKCKSSNFDTIPVSICMVSCQCSQYQGKTFLHWIGKMPINDFRKINIGWGCEGSKIVTNGIGSGVYSFITSIT